MNSPFFNLPSLELEENNAPASSSASSWKEASPFITQPTLNGKQPLGDPQTDQLVQMMSELYDEEMEEAMEDLSYEANELYESFLGNNTYFQPEYAAQQMILEHYAPMLGEIDRYFDQLIEKGTEVDRGTATTNDFEYFLNNYETTSQFNLSDAQEQFLGKILKSVGRAAGKALKTVAKFSPIGLLINALKPKISQFVKGFLQKGIAKLPKQYQGLAQNLAQKLDPHIAKITAELDDPVEAAQTELNAALAHWAIMPNSRELELFAREMERAPDPSDLDDASLQRARQEFTQGITTIKEGENPEPLVEQFLPVIAPILKKAINLIGKQRVIKTISPLIAGLISPLVGKENGRLLGTQIANAGINLLGEVPYDESATMAAEAVTATVEDTVKQVADLPSYVLEDRQLLERYVIQAFETAAATNLPDVLQEKVYKANPKLRESNRHHLMWKLHKTQKPIWGMPKIKQLNEVIDTELTPYMAQEIKTFGGIPLAVFLRDQMGVQVNATLPVRVHMVEGMPGSARYHLGKHLKGVSGLGSSRRDVYMQFHPLTSIAAGMLLGEPGVGCKSTHCLSNNRNVQGHRYYYLEMPGARPQWFQKTSGQQILRRSTGLRLKLDFFANEITLALFLSEADAQAIAVNLRKRIPETAHILLLMALQQGLDNVYKYAKAGGIKIVHPNVIPGKRSGMALDLLPPVVVQGLLRGIKDWIGSQAIVFLRDQAEAIVAAVEDHSDGMTLVVTLQSPPDFDPLRQMLSGQTISLQDALFTRGPAAIHLHAKPGFHHA